MKAKLSRAGDGGTPGLSPKTLNRKDLAQPHTNKEKVFWLEEWTEAKGNWKAELQSAVPQEF